MLVPDLDERVQTEAGECDRSGHDRGEGQDHDADEVPTERDDLQPAPTTQQPRRLAHLERRFRHRPSFPSLMSSDAAKPYEGRHSSRKPGWLT
jgi:hypothetical protein